MKLRATQVMPEGPSALFEIIDPTSKRTGWHIKVRDAIRGDEPEFEMARVTGGKKNPSSRLVTINEVCRAGFREANGGTGILTLTEWHLGLPVYTALIACWPGWTVQVGGKGNGGAVPIFKPLWSTDPERTQREVPWHEPPAHLADSQWGRTRRARGKE